MAFPTWKRCCAVTIPAAKISSSGLTGFPVLLTAGCLPSEMLTLGGANAAQANGGDIRFSADAAGTVQFPCEIVSWSQNASPASATAAIWVGVSQLTGSRDGVIYVWYKAATTQTQPAANSTFGSQKVWDSNYKLVWHAGNGTTLNLNDSTANANNLTNNGGVAAGSGSFGVGYASFTGANYLSGGTTGFPTNGIATLECWYSKNVDVDDAHILTFSQFAGGADSLISMTIPGPPSGAGDLHPSGYVKSAFQRSGSIGFGWNYAAFVYNSPAFYIVMNGNADNFGTPGSYGFNIGASLTIGAGAIVSGTKYLTGYLRGVRLSSVVRSNGWLATAYTNQNNPPAFAVPGTPFAPGQYASPGGYYGR